MTVQVSEKDYVEPPSINLNFDRKSAHYAELNNEEELKNLKEHIKELEEKVAICECNSKKCKINGKDVLKGRIIGKGASGVVYWGFDKTTGRIVALKEIQFSQDLV